MHQLAHTHPSRCGRGGGRWWEGQKQFILANGMWTAQDGLLCCQGRRKGTGLQPTLPGCVQT